MKRRTSTGDMIVVTSRGDRPHWPGAIVMTGRLRDTPRYCGS